MSQRYMMIRAQGRWSIVVLLVLLTVAPLAANAATRNVTAGTVSGNEYEDQVLGAGHGEGDVWGGEQGATPESDGELVPSEPADTPADARVDPGLALWLIRLASLFAWFRSSLWFSNLN